MIVHLTPPTATICEECLYLERKGDSFCFATPFETRVLQKNGREGVEGNGLQSDGGRRRCDEFPSQEEQFA